MFMLDQVSKSLHENSADIHSMSDLFALLLTFAQILILEQLIFAKLYSLKFIFDFLQVLNNFQY